MSFPQIPAHIIQEIANSVGLSVSGFINQDALSEADKNNLEQWQQRGFAGEMKFMERPSSLFVDARNFLPTVRSIISVAISYGSVPHPPFQRGFGKVARYAWGKDYHLVLRERLTLFAEKIKERCGSPIECRAFTDAVPFLERVAAQKSGLGFIGKNTLMIRKKEGSFFFLGEIFTSAHIVEESSEDFCAGEHANTSRVPQASMCGSCTNCITQCPTGAFAAPYQLDARRCISYLTIEKRGILSLEEGAMLGNWIFGCDICQEVCPFNHTPLKIGRKPGLNEFDPSNGAGPLLSLSEILRIRDQSDFKKRFFQTPLLRTKREGLIRNALAVVANTACEASLNEVTNCFSNDENSVVRTSALQTLFRMWEKGIVAKTHLQKFLDKGYLDSDRTVQAESERLMERF